MPAAFLEQSNTTNYSPPHEHDDIFAVDFEMDFEMESQEQNHGQDNNQDIGQKFAFNRK